MWSMDHMSVQSSKETVVPLFESSSEARVFVREFGDGPFT